MIELLHKQAAEIAAAGHNGWGNTMLDAAVEIERLRGALPADRRRPMCGTVGEEERQRREHEQSAGPAHVNELQEFENGTKPD